MHQHISHQFDAEMENLRNQVMQMGGIIEQQIGNAVKSLQELNIEQAEKVIKKDHQVNALEVTIDEECTRILARRQPAASDLRMVIAVIKTITDLERIGDEAARIGRMAVHLSEADGKFRKRYSGIKNLADQVQRQVHNALDSFARLDVDTAFSVVKDDEETDDDYQSLIRQLITYMMEDPRCISEVLDMLWTARSLERIGDHAKNICEYVIYLVKGKDIRHTDINAVGKGLLT